MIDPTILQTFADRLAGVPVNGHLPGDFPEPLATLWQMLDVAADPVQVILQQWTSAGQDRMDILYEIMKLRPGQPPIDPWSIFTLADAYQPRPPLEYIVTDTLVSPSLNLVYGAPGSLKSFLLADMAVCVAAGLPWLPGPTGTPRGRHVKQAPVLWYDFDNGPRRTHERFAALGRARSLPDTTPLYYVSMPTPPLDAGRDDSVQEMITRAKRLDIQLMFIDNLGLIKGNAEENTADMIPVMGRLRYLVETAKLALVVIHHQRKGGVGTGRRGETLRGHSSIEAALDLALLAERDGKSEVVTMQSTKSRDTDVTEFAGGLETTFRPNGKDLETARFVSAGVPQQTSVKRIEDVILRLVGDNPGVTKQALLRAARTSLGDDVSERMVGKVLGDLTSDGLLVTKPGSNNSVGFYLP